MYFIWDYQLRKKNKKKGKSQWQLWDTMRSNNICTMGTPRKIEKETESLFKEIKIENLQDVGKDIHIQAHKAQKSPVKLNPKKILLMHIMIEQSKIKNRILKAARERSSSHSMKPWKNYQWISQQIPIGLEKAGWYIQKAQRRRRKKKPNKNTLPRKSLL